MTVTDTTKITTKHWQHKRGTIGDVVQNAEDVRQCIETIMGLEKGSVPFAPSLGCELMNAVGEKSPDAVMILTAIYSKEIPIQEPRAELISVSGDYTADGQIRMQVYYKTDFGTDTAEVVL